MFGRVRTASSTLDCLELEKPPSKLIKDDSFSIYEVTLMKLKLEGNSTSLKVLNSSHIVSQGHNNEMVIDTNGSSSGISSSSSDCQSTGSLQQQQSRNLSILYLFSKFRSSGQGKSSSQEENMMIENDGSCVSTSTTSSRLEQDCISSFPVSQS
ncbi:hypothetical protein Pint_15635 [Pistacia integerrima]|uniref:Uncharacterized protein n=1 Tax=Pistacia integerrima TaxID=434235 RepID=A0ACC0ZAY0_9ROSI|nr:hypothetical protein Pint_15635 [Pistacia integerrima]